jgi:hypothetical protein
MKKYLLILITVNLVAFGLWAGPLKMVDVSFPQFNCLFSTNCILSSIDSFANIKFIGASGNGVLTTRTWQGAPGTALAGKYAYGYRIDLTRVMASSTNTYIDTLKVDVGTLVPFTYMGISTNTVWLGATNGVGTVAPSSALQIGKSVTFHFNPPLHPAAPGVRGVGTFYFGVVSSLPPTNSLATITGTQAGIPPMPLSTNLWVRSPVF